MADSKQRHNTKKNETEEKETEPTTTIKQN